MRETYDTLETIEGHISYMRSRMQTLQLEHQAWTKDPVKFRENPRLSFWKPDQCTHMIDIYSKCLDFWQRKYHRTLLNIPYVARCVEAMKKANAKQAGYKEEIINLLGVFEKPFKLEKA